MYWIDAFGEGYAVWCNGEIVELCRSLEKAEQLVVDLRSFMDNENDVADYDVD